MKKIWCISKVVRKLLFRGGGGFILFLFLFCTGIFIFCASKGDGVLINEIKLRFRYSLYFSTNILNIIALTLACVSIRKDIDGKQMHTLVSSPISRLQIWLGKCLGILIFCFQGLLVCLFAGILASCYMVRIWNDKVEVKTFLQEFNVVMTKIRPERESLNVQVNRKYQELKYLGKLPANKTEISIKRELFKQIKKSEQVLASGESKIWNFRLHAKPKSDFLLFKYRFFTRQSRDKFIGKWRVGVPGKVLAYEKTFTAYPYITNKLKIPSSVVPANGRFTIEFIPTSQQPVIFPLSNGLTVLYASSNFTLNIFKMLFFSSLNLLALIAFGLSVGTAFTFSVASFVSCVMYTLSLMSGIFTRSGTDSFLVSASMVDKLSSFFIGVGRAITAGIKPPGVILNLSEGIAISYTSTSAWLASFIVYFIVTLFIGLILFNRKELDRLH